MDYGSFIKVYDCSLSLLGKWNTPDGTFTVDTADILIISKILQFTEKKKKCYLSDAKLAEIIGKSDKSNIQKRLKKLERLEILKRDTFTETINGKSVSRRELSVLIVSRKHSAIHENANVKSTNGTFDEDQQDKPKFTGKEAFLQFMRDEYHVSRIPDTTKETLETIYNGEYMSENYYADDMPIPPDELLKLFQFVFFELKFRDKIKAKEAEKGMQGLTQFRYDLKVVLEYYNDFIDKGHSIYSH